MREELLKPIELMRRDELIDFAKPLHELALDIAALKTHPDYWAAPQFVHRMIDRACEVANG
jgi:hypothetical protein